jgi:hypothetical protein
MSSTVNQPRDQKFCERLEYLLENAFSRLGSQFSEEPLLNPG